MVSSKTKNLSALESTDISQRNESILIAATKIFAKRGYRNTDVQEIADELGIGKATIYRAFGTKEELFFAAVDYWMTKLSERMLQHNECNKKKSPEEMEKGILKFLSFFDENPDLIELLMQERSEFKHRNSHSYVRHWLANLPRWSSAIKESMAEGRIRELPVEELLEVVSGLCYGAIFTHYFSKKKINLEAMAKLMTDIVSYGIVSDRERSRRKKTEDKV